MRLRSIKYPAAQQSWAREGICTKGPVRRIRRFIEIVGVFAFLNGNLGFEQVLAQQKRMVLDGTIQLHGPSLPLTAQIRILHEDMSIARTTTAYDPRNSRFGIRLSSFDDFEEGERILIRVVLSPRDSFLARCVGGPLRFHGTENSTAAPILNVQLFRNQLPIIKRTLPDTTIKEGQRLSYRLIATDRDGDTVRFRIKKGPDGARIDPITGMFSWEPTYDQAGKHDIRMVVSDGYGEDSTRISFITVRNVNRPPMFDFMSHDTTIKEGDSLFFAVHASDPDADSVSYSLLMFPDGMRVDGRTGNGIWIPSFDQAGRYSILFLASDGFFTDTSQAMNILVVNVNRPPRFIAQLHDTTILEDQGLMVSYQVLDPDGDVVTIHPVSIPGGSQLSASGIFQWRPSFTQAGLYTVVVGASDSSSVAESRGSVRVLNANRPPTPVTMIKPAADDTIRLASPVRSVQFVWSKSADADLDDTLRYSVRIWGVDFDTTLVTSADTVIRAEIKYRLRPTSIYRWSVLVNDGTVSRASLDTLSFRTSAEITATRELISQTPKSYYLEQNLPDPFNVLTSIRYGLPERSYVKLTIFNMLGEPLIVLVSGEKDAGVYDVNFDVTEFTSGAYMFRLDAHPLAGSQSRVFMNTKKMIIVR
jgi:hypothetical protein